MGPHAHAEVVRQGGRRSECGLRHFSHRIGPALKRSEVHIGQLTVNTQASNADETAATTSSRRSPSRHWGPPASGCPDVVGARAGVAFCDRSAGPHRPPHQFPSPRWGIFDAAGVPVVLADNVVALDYRQEWILADYPLEQGAFETYDKVATPFEARVRFSSGGSALDRQALLTSIAGTIDIFTVITPEVIYPNVNVVHYDYRRAADRGVGLIAVDVFLRQVRVQSVPAFSNTQQPNGADQTGGGSVQTKAPTPTEGTVAGTTEPAPSVGNSVAAQCPPLHPAHCAR